MKARLILAILAVFLIGQTAISATARAASRTPAVIVRGAGSGTGTLTVLATVRVDPSTALVRTKGHFAGFWLLSPEHHRLVTGVFYLSFERGGVLTTTGLTLPRKVKAGTYDVQFFADAPATITLPVGGLPRTEVVQTAPGLHTRSAMRDIRPAAVTPVGLANMPVHLA